MDLVLFTLANQVAPILLQLAITVLVARAVLLAPKIHAFLDQHTTPAQQAFIDKIFEGAVHFAEAQGAEQVGAAKLEIACRFVDMKLKTAGITSIDAEDIVAGVQKAFAESTYAYQHAEKPVVVVNTAAPAVVNTEPPAGSPTGTPNADGTYPVVPNLAPVETQGEWSGVPKEETPFVPIVVPDYVPVP